MNGHAERKEKKCAAKIYGELVVSANISHRRVFVHCLLISLYMHLATLSATSNCTLAFYTFYSVPPTKKK